MTTTEKYYEDENGVLRGVCDRHGEFIGDAIGCPECLGEQEDAEALQYDADCLRQEMSYRGIKMVTEELMCEDCGRPTIGRRCSNCWADQEHIECDENMVLCPSCKQRQQAEECKRLEHYYATSEDW